MRLTLVNYAYDSALPTPQALLDRYWLLTGWAESLSGAGAVVTVVQGFRHDARLGNNGVDYRFVRGPFTPRLSRWRVPARVHRLIAGEEAGIEPPEVVHLNGLLYALQARHLRRRLPSRCPLVLQHHAETPGRGIGAAAQAWGLRSADGFFFTGNEMARPWRQRGLIRDSQPVFEVMEGISLFSSSNRATARAETGMYGRPVFLWAANLIPGKDPLTVLDGFEQILDEYPEARLYMAYRSAELLPQVRARLAASTALENAVELLGRLPYAQMEPVFNSADILLQGSLYEGSGIAVADALACGVVPVVTDIASFRFMTGHASVGALWAPRDAGALAEAIRSVSRNEIGPQRKEAAELFRRNLSAAAVGRQAVAAYRELMRLRSSSSEPPVVPGVDAPGVPPGRPADR